MSIKRAKEIFKATYTKDNMHWYYTYESELIKTHELLEHLEQQLTPHGDYACSDHCDASYIYRNTIVKKLMEALATCNINRGRVLYYIAILTYMRRYRAVSGSMKENNGK